MAINFGQQISAGLESAFDRVDRSRRAGLQAQRLNQQLQEFEHRQQMDRLAARVRQKQMQLQQETREEQLAQQAIENEFARERLELSQAQEERTAANQESMQRYRDAQINQMEARGQGAGSAGPGGRSDYVRVTEVQTNNSQIKELNDRLADINEGISQASGTMDMLGSEEGVTIEESMGNPEYRSAAQRNLSLALQKEQIQDQINRLRERNQQLFGGGDSQQQSAQSQQQQSQQPEPAPLDNL